ncbi:DUF748 domain-containing protein [Bermanella marisrubri]|uniref:OmpA-like domain-containing protein n=1 Tax=Bermanella marisrubri TaxID=207949 RepID=Q1N039_9GAMM|nr:DUF748 domain-containing protein [Bermanella marisrubri]EAT11524.1 hypothetical protein RED65_02599 [Oceanobacter sp. RED65] [Bermanella marisrubri]QIZ85011.1 DUF748 domain-containing protein [Bermanella marisrubri]
MKWFKRLFIVFLLLILATGASLQLAPMFAIQWLEDFYAQQGPNHKLQIQNWSLNLIDGELALSNIHAKWSTDQQATIDDISVDIRWLPLFNKQLVMNEIQLNGVRIPITEDDSNLSIAGIQIPLNGPKSSNTNQTSDNKDDNIDAVESGNPWAIEINSINIQQHTYQLNMKALSSKVMIEKLSLSNFHSLENRETSINLEGKIANLLMSNLAQADTELSINVQGSLFSLMKSPKFSGSVLIEDLVLQNPIAQLASLRIDGLNIEEQKLVSNDLILSGLALGEQTDKQFWLTLDKYWLNQLTLTSFGLTTGIHYVSGLKVNNYRDQNGEIEYSIAGSGNTEKPEEHQNSIEKDNSANSADDAFDDKGSREQIKEASSFAINIEGITLQDSKDTISTIWFRDQSIDPNYVVPMALKSFSVSALSMKDIDAPFEPDVNIKLMASVDNYSEINFNAQLNRKEGWPMGKASLELEQFNIIPLNGYMTKAIGYRAQKGMLNVNTQVTLNDETLNGETRIFLRNSKLEPKNRNTISRVSKQISMPVDTALDLLRDDNGNLQLSIPMSGKISDPDFAYDDVMNQLGTLALKTASMHYLQQSLQPYGALISLLSFATDSIMAIRLNQLDFKEEQTELSQSHKDYLDKVVKILTEKTELELQVCPYVSKQETQQETWAQLGQARAESVKTYLAQYNDKNSENLAKRTTLCVTEVADTPHVDLGV